MERIISKDVIRALKSGRDWAFKIVFEAYNARVFSAALKMGLSREDAEGTVQEVFIAIWDQRKSINTELSFNAFVLTIAKRKIIGIIRKNIARANREADLLYQGSIETSLTEDYVILKEMMSQAKEEIQKLPKRQQQIFMLSKEEGLKNDEIAKRLGLSKRTVENQLFRATRDLKESLNLKSGSH